VPCAQSSAAVVVMHSRLEELAAAYLRDRTVLAPRVLHPGVALRRRRRRGEPAEIVCSPAAPPTRSGFVTDCATSRLPRSVAQRLGHAQTNLER
jgi:hypothetical protein